MIHKAFTIGFADNGLVLIQHSLDDEDTFQSHVVMNCGKLMEVLSYRLRESFNEYSEWSDYYGFNPVIENIGEPAECVRDVKISRLSKSDREFNDAKDKDGPPPVFNVSKSGARISIRKKR